MSAPTPGHRDPGVAPIPEDPGQRMHAACERFMALAEAAPDAVCPTPQTRVALRRLLMWTFQVVYDQDPDQTRTRATGGGFVKRIHPQHLLHDGGNGGILFLPAALFAQLHPSAGATTPGETFGVAVVFCDATGTEVGASVATLLPAGRHFRWPPPLSFVSPLLDTVCNVLYIVVDRTPLEAFGGDPACRAAFREALFARVMPTVYSEANAAHRLAGRAFWVRVAPDGTFQISLDLDDAVHRREVPWVYGSTTAGEDFPLVLEFATGLTQCALPCAPWPSDLVTPWLRERPGSDACRECGQTATKLKKCSRCRAVWYCSAACQHADWRRHTRECRMLAGARDPSV